MKQTRPKIKKVIPEPMRISLMEKIAGLVREEIGSAAKLVNFDCELETLEGTIRINWAPITRVEINTDANQHAY